MKDFKQWWDEDDLTTQGNPFADGTPAYWAWEGWSAGVKTEREACAKLCDELHPGLSTKRVAEHIRARSKNES